MTSFWFSSYVGCVIISQFFRDSEDDSENINIIGFCVSLITFQACVSKCEVCGGSNSLLLKFCLSGLSVFFEY